MRFGTSAPGRRATGSGSRTPSEERVRLTRRGRIGDRVAWRSRRSRRVFLGRRRIWRIWTSRDSFRSESDSSSSLLYSQHASNSRRILIYETAHRAKYFALTSQIVTSKDPNNLNCWDYPGSPENIFIYALSLPVIDGKLMSDPRRTLIDETAPSSRKIYHL